MGYSPQGHKELDKTEATLHAQHALTFLKQGELICKKPSNSLRAIQWMAKPSSILGALTFSPQIFTLEGRHLNARGPGAPWSQVPVPSLPLAA